MSHSSQLIYEGNKKGRAKTVINNKGFMIGNAVLNDATDQQAYDDIDIYSIYTPTCLSALQMSRRSSRLLAAPRLFSRQVWPLATLVFFFLRNGTFATTIVTPCFETNNTPS